MSNAVDLLEKWFGELPPVQQKEVVTYLFGGKVIMREGQYFGPFPVPMIKGLYSGPAPLAAAVSHSVSRTCPTCGKPW